MADYVDKIKELEDLIKNSKYNKKTQHAIGLYKAQLARLKEKQESRSKKSGPKDGYFVRKTGDATVLLLGFPSVGKSTLLNKLTNQESEVGAYDFTTLSVIPGLLDYKHAKIQILDVPGIVKGAAAGTGRGREVLSVMRNADLALILIDAIHPEHLPVILKEIYDAHIRVNQRRPDVKITKTAKDGIKVAATVKLDLKHDTIKAVFREFKISNADVIIRNNITIDQLIDCIEDNKKYLPTIHVLTKIDLVSESRLKELVKNINPDIIISAKNDIGIDDLKEQIFEKLDFMRVYLKEPGKEADMDVPLITFKNATIRSVCEKLHKDMVRLFKFARISGPSAKFSGQKVSLNHVLKDGDVLEIHLN
ncbi:MAG: GTP-binding protein [Nanoarchaeota archaeon]|nr:GTP-binding protein [Nanoarchaeota archaeon]MBU1269259.1 GTP-binding protein [Nanoarchaeota archaeon]MBU1604213.1 GTP-binding protein [Nanoarchaeota archaeon]MBU2443272.1 GTP-binding protein [Nanoarchaeota archaeon]